MSSELATNKRSEYQAMRPEHHAKLFRLCFPHVKYDEDKPLPSRVEDCYWNFRGSLLELEPNADVSDEALVFIYMQSGGLTEPPPEMGVVEAVSQGHLRTGGVLRYRWKGKLRKGKYAGLKGTQEVEVLDEDSNESRVVKASDTQYVTDC